MSTATASAAASPAARMTHENFRERVLRISATAGMNQRYHQHEAKTWRVWDAIAKAVTALLAIIGVSLALVCALVASGTLDWAAVVVSLLAATAAVILNIVPLGSWEKEHVDLFRRWTDLREEIDGLEFDIAPGDPPPKMIQRIQELDAKLHRICGAETIANKALWWQCEQDERRSRGLPPLSSQQPSSPLWRRISNWLTG